MTLSGISYLVDIYRRKIKPRRIFSILHFTFLFRENNGRMIIRYSDVSKQIRKPFYGGSFC